MNLVTQTNKAIAEAKQNGFEPKFVILGALEVIHYRAMMDALPTVQPGEPTSACTLCGLEVYHMPILTKLEVREKADTPDRR